MCLLVSFSVLQKFVATTQWPTEKNNVMFSNSIRICHTVSHSPRVNKYYNVAYKIKIKNKVVIVFVVFVFVWLRRVVWSSSGVYTWTGSEWKYLAGELQCLCVFEFQLIDNDSQSCAARSPVQADGNAILSDDRILQLFVVRALALGLYPKLNPTPSPQILCRLMMRLLFRLRKDEAISAFTV